MSLTPLQVRILDAHKRGDQRALEKLQAEYRRTGTLTAADRGGVQPIRLVEPAAGVARRPASTSTGPKVELRANRPARFEVSLGETAFKIERQAGSVFSWAGRFVETGGWLFAHYRPSYRQVIVVHASDSGPASKHWSGRVELSTVAEVEAEFDEWTARAGLRLVGSWHTHDGYGNGVPSPQDLRSGAGMLEETGLLNWTELIVTPSREIGWLSPEFHGWVVWRSVDPETLERPLVCDPATVVLP